MKLNFLNVLNGKSTHEEIAEQIVALEIKQKECEEEREIAKYLCKEVRGKVLCGEKVSQDAVKDADKAYEEASLNLEVVTESIEELKKKLYEALQTYRDDETKRLADLRKRLEAEREKAMREFAKARGRLLGVALGIYKYPDRERINLIDINSFLPSPDYIFLEEFETEKNRALSELKKPTVADLEQESERKDAWLRNFNLEDEYKDIIRKYQSKVPASAG
jgi:hypothetical protein